MHISLFYNEDAGDGASLKHIRKTIERHGHTLVQVVATASKVARLLEEPTELVVAVGGDGTVSAVARVLAKQGIPLAILPAGTANNIAKSLGIDGPIDDLIEKWDRGTLHPFDVGVASGAWGERLFFESIGCGLIPAGIAAAQAHPADEEQESPGRLVHAAGKYREVLSRLTPRPWTIDVGGAISTGEFLLIEVLNTPAVGSNLVLSSDANPSDGFFSVVTAGEEHRDTIREYLEHLIAGDASSLSLEVRHATHVELQGRDDLHVDDELLRSTSAGIVSIGIEPAALHVLT